MPNKKAQKPKRSGAANAGKAAKGKTQKQLITGSMKIGEAVHRYPHIARVFLQHGLFCVGCGAAAFETIEQGAMAHGIPTGPLLADLNKAAKAKN